MINRIEIKNTIKPFNKKISVDGDKSISIRWLLLASQATGKSKAHGILKSEDILSTINCLRKLGVKINVKKNYCEVNGVGINGYKYRNNINLNAGNSGTLARLILGLLVHSNKKIKITGDESLSKRDFLRVIKPLRKFGAKFENKKKGLPLIIEGTNKPKAIYYLEKKGSAQCKSSIMLASLNTPGETKIKARKSRNHTELFFKNLRIPIKIKSDKNFDLIKIKKVKKLNSINYKIPSDISSSAFFIVLTALSKNSQILIKNVNVNSSRIGIIKILTKMGINIFFKNKRIYKNEKIADIFVKSSEYLKPIKCPPSLNSSAIDEFLLIFLVAAKAKGVSYFSKLNELNQKESPRLEWGAKILDHLGAKYELKNDSIKIFGNPNLKNKNRVIIKNYLKDHRVFMTSVVASLIFGGRWIIHDPNSIKTSFPSFLKIIKKLNKNILK
jgi:3-phosphoshikimate 1-carboxyvinyltransferase